jgi:hypothetical protein
MIILGLVLIAIGLLVPKLAIFFTIGLIVLIAGALVLVLGYAGHPIGGRRSWW